MLAKRAVGACPVPATPASPFSEGEETVIAIVEKCETAEVVEDVLARKAIPEQTGRHPTLSRTAARALEDLAVR